MNIDHLVIVDTDSGTYFPVSAACLLDLRQLTDSQLDDFSDGCDSDRNELAQAHGTSLTNVLALIKTHPDIDTIHG